MRDNQILTPSQKGEKKQKEKEEQQAKAQAEADNLRADMNETFSTAAGKNVLGWIMRQCGYNEPATTAINGRLDADATMYNAMRQGLYLTLRRFINPETLREVEYD